MIEADDEISYHAMNGSRTKTNTTKFAQYIVPLSGVVFYLKQLDLLRP